MSIFHRLAVRARTNAVNAVRAFRNRLKFGEVPSTGPSVYISYCNPNIERYFYLLARFFADAGWNVRVKASPNLLLNLRNFNELIYNIDKLRFVTHRPTCDLEISSIDVDYFGVKQPGSFVMPYNMHPEVYDLGIDVKALRSNPRPVKVLFAGNSGWPYENPDIRDLFGKVNRKRIEELFESTEPYIATEYRLPETNVLLRKEVRLTVPQWMETLAFANFYIAAPGVSMPFSHNAIEAMAVGTIPIIEYGEMFYPPLEHEKNCIMFSGEADFIRKIEECKQMDVTALRQGVIDYYETYLAPEAAIRNLTARPFSKLYLNAEHLSVIALNASRPSTLSDYRHIQGLPLHPPQE